MEIELLADLESLASKATTADHLVYLLQKRQYIDESHLLSALQDLWIESLAKLTTRKLEDLVKGEPTIGDIFEAVALYFQLETLIASQKMLMSDSVWKCREDSRDIISRFLRLIKKRREDK